MHTVEQEANNENTFGSPEFEKKLEAIKSSALSKNGNPSANVSVEELNQSYHEQLERRLSDINIELALKNKQLQEAQKQKVNDEEFTKLQEENRKQAELIAKLCSEK